MTTEWTTEFKHPIDYLLLELGDYLLKEDDGQIVLEQTGNSSSLWTEETKN